MTTVMATFGGFPTVEAMAYSLEVRIDAGGDEGGHVESLAEIRSATTDESATFPGSGLRGMETSPARVKGGLIPPKTRVPTWRSTTRPQQPKFADRNPTPSISFSQPYNILS
jgi:hypothetical protein